MTPLTLFYNDPALADAWLNDDRLLALVRFGVPATPPADPRVCVIPLPALSGRTTVEVWLGARPAQTGCHSTGQRATSPPAGAWPGVRGRDLRYNTGGVRGSVGVSVWCEGRGAA